jgi:HEPN domain-containing protein
MRAPPDEVKAWLRKAMADLLAARILVAHTLLVSGPAAFHCQQAVEKALKAFLVWQSVPFERVHSLVYLMDLCEEREPGFAALREETEILSPYATEIRYPGESPDISPADARRALEAAEAVWDYVLHLFPPDLLVAISRDDPA